MKMGRKHARGYDRALSKRGGGSTNAFSIPLQTFPYRLWAYRVDMLCLRRLVESRRVADRCGGVLRLLELIDCKQAGDVGQW